ncbi:uncharacterized protein RJT20DRAFT_51706 [Scheffersomyces xylosifermentans]|uniref:uncharacterized protein n=1 Tax=Scheffersomyces xylosifermentans TaxID=1304137 RepID=UPI00315CFEB9
MSNDEEYDDEKPPTYIPNPKIEVNPEKILEHPPEYFDANSWKFVICNKTFSRDLNVFVSADSIDKYRAFRKAKADKSPIGVSRYANELQLAGIGVPLLKVQVHPFHFNKFLTIQKYYIDHKSFPLRGFDPKVDFYDFCKVQRYRQGSYTTYELCFTPDPNDKQKNFQVVVFAHKTLPISDYIYKGNRYRWVREGRKWSFEYNYSNFLLDPEQHSLTDNWDRKTNRLDTTLDPNNPLIGGGFMSKLFSTTTDRERYYSSIQLGSLRELNKFILFGEYKQRAQYTMGDIYNSANDYVNYESIDSVNLDALSMLCTGLLFKREEDVKDLQT